MRGEWFVLLMLLDIVSTVLGFVGYYCDNKILVIIFFNLLMIQLFIEVLKGHYKSLIPYISVSVISYIVAKIFNLSPKWTVAIALCYLNAIVLIYGYIKIILFTKHIPKENADEENFE